MHDTVRRRVAQILPAELRHSWDLLTAVREYGLGHLKWHTVNSPHLYFYPHPVPDFSDLKVDGALCYVDRPEVRDALAQLRVPKVDVFGALANPGMPVVCCDPVSVGRRIGQYLKQQGYDRFACIERGHTEDHDIPWSDQLRIAAFHREVGDLSGRLRWQYNRGSSPLTRPLMRFVKALPKPVAIMACNAASGLRLLELCHEHHWQVPEQVAVVAYGWDTNAPAQDRLGLSCVGPQWYKIGIEAVELLERMMRGEPVANAPVHIAPSPLIENGSSDVSAKGDPVVQRALGYIKLHYAEPLTVSRVAESAMVCRRTLELRTVRSIGRTVLDEIHRVRMERARRLLHQTHLPIRRIAEQCGYSSPQRFATVFGEREGCSPTQWRKQVEQG